ncbi:hypothetical protein [Spongorhabdus nitratireducens]
MTLEKLKSFGIAAGCALSLLILQTAQAEEVCSGENAACQTMQIAGLWDKAKKKAEDAKRKAREIKEGAEGRVSGLSSEDGHSVDELPASYECHSDEACERIGIDEDIKICTRDGECYGDRINEEFNEELDDNTDDNSSDDNNPSDDNPFSSEEDNESDVAGPSCDRSGNCTNNVDEEDLDGGPGSLPPKEDDEEKLSDKVAAWEAEQERVNQVEESQRAIRRQICSEVAEDGSCELEGIMIKSQKVADRHIYTFVTHPYGSVHVAVPESELVASGTASLFEAADFVKARVVFDVNGWDLNMMILRGVEPLQ